MGQMAGALLIAGVLAAVGSGRLDALIQSSTGVDLNTTVPELGLPLFLQLNVFTLLAAAIIIYSIWPRKQSVYVLDFAVLSPPASWRFPRAAIRPLAERHGKILPEHIDFLEKIAYRTGLGDDTSVVPVIQEGDESKMGIGAAREEFAACCFPCVEEVLQKTGIKAKEIDFVVTNSSLFNPTPSLSTTVMNHFKMGKKTKGYSLGGMGCSAGVIAVDLAKELLELHPNTNVLVVSHENISNAFYTGMDPSMLLINVLFRANGAAVIMTNKPKYAGRSKYLVQHVVRTNLACDDVAFNCVMQLQDEQGMMGVRLNKDIVQVGTRALRDNMTSLGPVVLPLSEKLTFAANMITRQLSKSVPALKGKLPESWTKPYVPDFRKAFDHFCIHTGGRGIIDGLEKELKLTRPQVEPSRASLYRFGNTSSTSVWYELAYIETRQGVDRSNKVWQLAFGSGFKFNSSVMIAKRAVRESHRAWQGFDAAAMWVELDALEASAKAARAAKAARQAEEAAAAAAAAAMATSCKPEEEVKAEVKEEIAQAAVEPPLSPVEVSPFETVPDAVSSEAADQVADTLQSVPSRKFGSATGQASFKLMGSKSLRRMPSVSRRDSLVAVGSGAVSVADIHHLEDEVDVVVDEP